MDFIKNWTFSVCATLIISVIFSVVSPKGTMGKFYKVIISLFIFASFIFPLTDFDSSDFFREFDFESEYQTVVEDTAEIKVKSIIEAELEKNGIKSAVVSCEASESDNEISIDKVTIAVADAYECESVKDIVFNSLGIVAEVKHIGE